jgi:outer membrane receptor protein involved in Fe transport
MRVWLHWILLGFFSVGLGRAQVTVLPPVTVTASRFPQTDSEVPFSMEAIGGEDLADSPSLTIDDALRSAPDFSLFRRDNSLTANPTSQGVSLRGLGPSGASRSLVLLDGMLLNDPFGGWVPWSLVPRLGLAGAELAPGGGATAWGNSALAGVIQLLTAPSPAGSGAAEFQTDGFGTHGGEFAAATAAGGGTLELRGDDFASDGFVLVAPESRGPIDVAAASRHQWASATWHGSLDSDVEATFAVRGFQEWRDNGTPYQQNNSRQNFASAGLNGHAGPDFIWTVAAYVQNQGFSQTFSSVNAARTAETPASDQFAVPTTAAGLAETSTWLEPLGGKTIFGFDARDVRGETREDYFFSGGSFAKQRFAGGRQTTGGFFVEQVQTLAAGLSATVGLRADRWEDSEGHLRQSTIATGALSTDELFPNRAGTEWSPSTGLVWEPAPAWQLRIAGQRSYRLPTLNELYRPFQQGSTVTEANPALETEHADTAEIAATWKRGPWRFEAQGFATQLNDAVSNVEIAQGPGTFPYFGTLPAGGIGQERLNLDRVRSDGLQIGASWRPSEAWSADFALLDEEAVVTEARVAPSLVGRELPEVPRYAATAGVTLQPVGWLRLRGAVRRTGLEFDDGQNQLPLNAATVADASVTWICSRRLEIFASVDNLANARVETAHSAAGVFNVAAPRMAGAGARVAW